MFSVTEWIIIALVLILLFGANRIPRIAQGMGKGIRNFLDSLKEDPDAEKPVKTENKQE